VLRAVIPSDELIRELCYDAPTIHCWHTAYRSDEANSAAAEIVPAIVHAKRPSFFSCVCMEKTSCNTSYYIGHLMNV
jgi:hypothetical protein